jgi:hypothetical protein
MLSGRAVLFFSSAGAASLDLTGIAREAAPLFGGAWSFPPRKITVTPRIFLI